MVRKVSYMKSLSGFVGRWRAWVFLYFSAPLMIAAFPVSAFAASCSSNGGNFSVTVGARTVLRDIAGQATVIPKIGTASPYRMDCPGDASEDRDAYVKFTVASAPVTGYSDVYPTNVSGLGVKYHFATNSGNGCNIPFDKTLPNSSYTITCHISAGTTLSWSWGASVEFIKTGAISPGSITSIPAVTMSYSLNNQSGNFSLNNMYSGIATGTIVVPTCTISVNDVELKTVMWSGFASTTTLANTPFQFNLTACPSGMANFTYRIDPVTTAIDPTNGVFANSTGAGMAQGVGLRLTDSTGSAAVRLDGTNYSVSNYSSAVGGTASIPMSVSYFRTGTAAQVTGGMVRGTAQLTLFYR